MASKTNRNEKIRQLREKGLKLQEIADRYGITRERVRQLVPPANTASRVQERRRRVKLLFHSNRTCVDIAQELGVKLGTIYQDMRLMGLRSITIVQKRYAQGIIRCRRCSEDKPFSEFSAYNLDHPGGGICRECAAAYTKRWVEQNRDHVNAYQLRRYHEKKAKNA